MTAVPGTAAALQEASAQATVAPIKGSFDIYLGAPDSSRNQLLRWVDTVSGQKITEITIRADDQTIVRAGQYVYFYQPGTRAPRRVNTAGSIEPVPFADPPSGTEFYQFLPSATGNYVAWLIVATNNTFSIHIAGANGTDARQVGGATLLAGETVKLLRVSNDGGRIFFDRRPAGITYETRFAARSDIYLLDTLTGQTSHLPGEPACGESLLCDASVSSDGAFLIRTLPASLYQQPVVVTNLLTSVVLARFTPPEAPSGFSLEVGYPFLTPGGELVYAQAFGPPQLESYRLIWANIVTGDQHVIVDLGHEKHRPLGWAADGVTLLTTREPLQFDTWQINTQSGSLRQIAGMLFLGHVEEPPPSP
jgi:hypothetical protein